MTDTHEKHATSGQKMELEFCSIGSVKPYPSNPRKNDAAVHAVARSIKEFGWRQPIVVDGDMVVIAGHTRLKAAQKLGLDAVPVLVARDLTPDQVKAYRIADNRTADPSQWDEDLLVQELLDIDSANYDVGLTGFTIDDLESMTAGTEDDDDSVPHSNVESPLPDNPVSKHDDVWIVGNHRIMCGDCRSIGDVTRLAGGSTVDLAITSPPYASQRKYDESTDFAPIPPDQYCDWFDAVQQCVRAIIADSGSWVVNIKEHCESGQRSLYVKDLVLAHVRAWNWRFVDEYVWIHGGTPKAPKQRFKNGYEPLFHFAVGHHKWRPDAVAHHSDDVPDWGGLHPNAEEVQKYGTTEGMARRGVNARKKRSVTAHGDHSGTPGATPTIATMEETGGRAYPSNVVQVGKNREALGHPAAYSDDLPAFFIKCMTDQGDVVFDPFLGSGSTIIAAHKCSRAGLGMDLSPAYVDIAVKRVASVVGVDPVLDDDGRTFNEVRDARIMKGD